MTLVAASPCLKIGCALRYFTMRRATPADSKNTRTSNAPVPAGSFLDPITPPRPGV
jgi:hypothetical protein